MAGASRLPKNIIFWGAGATQALGIRTTVRQQHFIRCITGSDEPGTPLKKRIKNALGPGIAKQWHDALFDLITILGDAEKSHDSINTISGEQRQAMARNWRLGARKEELEKRIVDLRLMYDWPALKSVVSICPGSATDKFRLNDVFNLLDMHIPPGFGFRAPTGRRGIALKNRSQQQFFDARRLVGAKNALLVILIASFYIDYQVCIDSKKRELSRYYEFAKALGCRMQKQGVKLASKSKLDQPTFYNGDVAFVSLNYDPIALWVQFFANRTLNNDPAVPRVGSGALPLHLFHDFGHLIPARRIEKGEDDWPWYPLNEGAAQRLNEIKNGSARIRLTKFLFPHGCLCWRECPDCGKLSAYHGDSWELRAPSLFPPPPLRTFDKRPCASWIKGEERVQREKGKVDARKCLHCGTLTYAHHTQAVMQSSFKPQPPSFIEEIQRELRATTMQANHIIFMGYSLPQDDVTYRAFFSARRQRGDLPVKCTVVDFDQEHQKWYGTAKLARLRGALPESSPIHAACDIFGGANVRFFGGGVPNVFLDKGKVTPAKLQELLVWKSTP